MSDPAPDPNRPKKPKRVLLSFIICGALYLAVVLLNQFGTSPAAELGVTDGRLAGCPDSPNCVSSQADPGDDVHFIDPLPVPADVTDAEAADRLAAVVDTLPGSTLVERREEYLRFTFSTLVMRFVDDVEFLVSEDRIDVRSASRLGRSDLGANRARVEAIRVVWDKALRGVWKKGPAGEAGSGT